MIAVNDIVEQNLMQKQILPNMLVLKNIKGIHEFQQQEDLQLIMLQYKKSASVNICDIGYTKTIISP